MKKNKLFFAGIYLSLALLSAACSSNTGTQTTEGNPPATTNNDSSASGEEVPANPVMDARGDSTITLSLPAGDSSVVMLGRLERLNQHLTVNVPVQGKSKLTATLMPLDSLQNIRFSQVIHPNGEAEGPFGKEVSVATSANGTYQLLITHNLMAEGGLAKDFKLRVTLTQ